MPTINLDSEVQYLKGVGPRRAAVLGQIGIKNVRDLLYYLPRRYLDRSMVIPIGSLKVDMTNVTVVGKVLGKGILKGRKQRLEVVLGDDSGHVSLIWFSGIRYLEKVFNKGDVYSVTGSVSYFMQQQIVHPEVERIEDEAMTLLHTGRIVPVYPSTAELKKAGVTGRVFRRIINLALTSTREQIKDYLPADYLSEYQLRPLREALFSVHYPAMLSDAEPARRRLAFDEFVELQYLILQSRKENSNIRKKHSYKKPGDLTRDFLKNLPFRLTDDQKETVEKIYEDLQSERPMHRLVQGDVGCGKTVVALAAAVFAAENNLQTAFMAPTELLAEQHYRTWGEALENIGIRSVLITGSIHKKERREIETSVTEGKIAIVFGTHAVISEPLKFKHLGLVIIDEQHRFGVRQRSELIAKGAQPDILVMSATPIPRTLAMTLYGDLDISSIKSMPPGRQPSKTVWRTANSRPEIYDYLKDKLARGNQLFVIYPLVEKSEKLDLQAAEDEYKNLKKNIFPKYKIGLVHGRLKKEKREEAIRAFRNKELDILVATTVIEVGIDIPTASIMVIEHAERFGLSQLHQLRGRVGRGSTRGLTVAVATPPISDLARKRLDLFQATSDGFKIAEADLNLRGPGEFFGARQHGLPELRVASLTVDVDLLPIARKLVVKLLSRDKPLDSEYLQLLKYLDTKVAGRKNLGRTG
jgi:ATP-dependent DNA helicase RecG